MFGEKNLAPENGKALHSKSLENKFSFDRAYPPGLCHKKEKRISKKYQVVLLAYFYFVLKQSELRAYFIKHKSIGFVSMNKREKNGKGI
jgi:hypothetical protein